MVDYGITENSVQTYTFVFPTGWAKVGITWAYCIVVWLLADVAKTLSQSLFVRQERVKEDCKMHHKAVPAWARAIDWPGELAESACECFERALKVNCPL